MPLAIPYLHFQLGNIFFKKQNSQHGAKWGLLQAAQQRDESQPVNARDCWGKYDYK